MTHDPISVLGAGAIGGAVARTLLAAGHPVTVWNRAPGRAAPLSEAGAAVAADAADAAAAGSLAILCLTDYDAVDDVLDRAGTALAGRTVAVLTTGSPDEAARAARTATEHGADYLDGGLQTGPDGIGTPAATLLFSGSADGFARHRPVLALLGTATYLGADPTAAAVHDLALFGLWYDAQLGLLRAFATVAAAGVDPLEFASKAAVQLGHVLGATAATADEIASGTFPRGPADLREHAAVLAKLVALRGALRLGLGDGGLPAVVDLVADRAERGEGERGLNSLAV